MRAETRSVSHHHKKCSIVRATQYSLRTKNVLTPRVCAVVGIDIFFTDFHCTTNRDDGGGVDDCCWTVRSVIRLREGGYHHVR